jgi:ribose transport system substrate-binding protein
MQKNVVSTSARENGFLDAAKETGLTVELETYLGITTGDAMRATRKIVAQLEKVDGIFTPNESTTQGVLIALSHSTVHRPVHIGFDLNNSIAQAIQSGNLYATIVQDPYQMGYQGVKFITQEKHKSATPQKIETPIYLITKENLGEFR